MATDARGRLWVAENYTYAEAKAGFDLKQRDRIVILEDTDRDGRADKRTVFYDQAQRLTSVEVGFGGVYALCAPQLLFFPDKNGDDIPDGKPVVLLDGFDSGPVRHNIVNGLRWGPDGWLYGRHGIQATSRVGAPGTPDAKRIAMNCAIWRFHPVQKIFEVVASGTTNPWGMDWDQYGEAFFINTVIGHLWHLIPGAHYRRMYGEDLTPHTYELIEQHADHFHWDATGQMDRIARREKRRGRARRRTLARGLPHLPGRRVAGGIPRQTFHDQFLRTPREHGASGAHGSGYVAKHGADFLTVGDPWFRGSRSARRGGRRRLHVRLERHRRVPRKRRRPPHQRAHLQDHRRPRRHRRRPISPGSRTRELAQLQLSPNEWLVRQSRRLLQERAAAGGKMADAQTALLAMSSKETPCRSNSARSGRSAPSAARMPKCSAMRSHIPTSISASGRSAFSPKTPAR